MAGESAATIRGVRVAGRTEVTAGLRVEVVADERAVRALAHHGKRTDDDALASAAERFVQTHQLLGLDVKSLKRIII